MHKQLQELLRPTPLGRTKLIAAWDGLDVPTQLEVLAEVVSCSEGTSRDRAFWEKALASRCEYVRYVAARDADLNERDPNDLHLLEQVAADSSVLVRNARAHAFYPEPEQFAAFPLEKKLILVGGDDPPNGERFAQWVELSIGNEATSEQELLDVVAEYMRNPKLREKSEYEDIDGLTWWSIGKEFTALWNLVPKAPKPVAIELLRHLPVQASFGIGYDMPEELLKWVETSPYLSVFLWREDVEMSELRRKIFFSTEANYDKWVKGAAASHHFNLLSEEFAELLKDPKGLIREVAHSGSVSPVYLEALEDHDIAIFASAKRRAQKLTGTERVYELARLKLYRLARQAVPWTGDKAEELYLPEALKFLESKIQQGNTWATFMAFEAGFPTNLIPWLPPLRDIETAQEIESNDAKRESAEPASPAEVERHDSAPFIPANVERTAVASLQKIWNSILGCLRKRRPALHKKDEAEHQSGTVSNGSTQDDDVSELLKLLGTKEVRNYAFSDPSLRTAYLQVFEAPSPQEAGARTATFTAEVARVANRPLPKTLRELSVLLYEVSRGALPDPKLIGDVLSHEWLSGRFQDDISALCHELNPKIRDQAESWLRLWWLYLFRIRVAMTHGNEFMQSMMGQVRERLVKLEQLDTNTKGWAFTVDRWVQDLDDAVIKFKDVKFGDSTAPAEYIAALTFLMTDPKSPYYKQSEIEDDVDTKLAVALVEMRAKVTPWIDSMI